MVPRKRSLKSTVVYEVSLGINPKAGEQVRLGINPKTGEHRDDERGAGDRLAADMRTAARLARTRRSGRTSDLP